MSKQETKFTPGPWEHYKEHINAGPDHKLIFQTVRDSKGLNVARLNDVGTAKLIAAAPEMFGTLDNVLSVLLDLDQDHLNRREEQMVCEAIQDIEAVLAKARGE